MANGVVTTDHVVRSIDSFTELVSRYLTPVIRFVGHKDAKFETLSRIYPGLLHERHYSGEPADLVVFDHLPMGLLEPRLILSADSAYLFYLQPHDALSHANSVALEHLNALTLIDPKDEVFLWHVRALLLVKELSYSNGEASFADLLSVNSDQRATLAQLVDTVLNRRTCVVFVSNDELVQLLLEFLFGAMPEIIAPVYVDPDTLVPDLLASDRYNIVLDASRENVRRWHDMAAAPPDASQRALLLLTTPSEPGEAAPVDAISLCLDAWTNRPADAHLMAYWVSAWQSHSTGIVAFHTSDHIKNAQGKAKHDPIETRRLLMGLRATSDVPDDILVSTLDTYQRLSLDNILEESERQIMMKLRSLSPLVEAASHAAGIKLITFHKRTRRLSAKSSLIELFASTRKS